MKLDTNLNDIDRVGDRTVKYIRYFGKEVQADKFLLSMILIIVIEIALLIVGFMLDDKTVPVINNFTSDPN